MSRVYTSNASTEMKYAQTRHSKRLDSDGAEAAEKFQASAETNTGVHSQRGFEE